LCAYFATATPIDDRERESIAEFLTVVPTLADPFNEHADIRHVTASALVVGERGVVLHLHKRLALWLQPGGHIDAGEDPATAAVREATEELGLAVAHPHDGPQLIHVDGRRRRIATARAGTGTMTCGTCCSPATTTRTRVPTKARSRGGSHSPMHMPLPTRVCRVALPSLSEHMFAIVHECRLRRLTTAFATPSCIVARSFRSCTGRRHPSDSSR
jgi:hypothetical protein